MDINGEVLSGGIKKKVTGTTTDTRAHPNDINPILKQFADNDVTLDKNIDDHIADSVKHITAAERTAWNAKASTSIATSAASGLMSAADKGKLDGVATGANNYTHPAMHPPSIITQDANNRFVTDAEKTAWNAKASTAAATTSASGLMSAADKSKLDGVAAGANNYTHPAMHPPSIITQDANNRFVTDAEKVAWNAKASTSVATTGTSGLMSAADKSKLDGVAAGANNYTHPATHPPSIIEQDANNRFITDAERNKLSGIATGANNYTHPTGAGSNHIPAGGAAGQFLKYSAAGVATWAAISKSDAGLNNVDNVKQATKAEFEDFKNDALMRLAHFAYLSDPNRNILTVAKVGGQFNTINAAIEYAKTYCTPFNRVVIYIGPGVYSEEIILYPNPGIDFIGSGSTVTSVQFPSIYPNSPIHTMGSGYIADIGFISSEGGENSYAFHFESQVDPATGLVVFDRCSFLSYNNAGVGIGMGQDTTIQFNGCDIASVGYTAIYGHNLPSSNTSNQLIEFNSCKITPYGHVKCITIDDAAKIQGKTNSVMYISFANCQSNQPYISYRIGASSYLSYIPKTGSDIHLGGNSKNTNILGCDVDFGEFGTGGIIAVMSTGLFTVNLANASKYNYTPLSAVDSNGLDILSTVNFVGTSDGYVVFSTSAASVKGSTINFNVMATAK